MCSPNGWDNTQSGVIRDELVEGIHPDAVPSGRRVIDPFRPKPGDDRTAMSQRTGDPGGPDRSGSSPRSYAGSIGVASQQAYAGRSPVLDAAQLEVLRSYGSEHDMAAGEVLFADGDLTYDLIVVVSGEARIIERTVRRARRLSRLMATGSSWARSACSPASGLTWARWRARPGGYCAFPWSRCG